MMDGIGFTAVWSEAKILDKLRLKQEDGTRRNVSHTVGDIKTSFLRRYQLCVHTGQHNDCF